MPKCSIPGSIVGPLCGTEKAKPPESARLYRAASYYSEEKYSGVSFGGFAEMPQLAEYHMFTMYIASA
jgi:hypothetical protein